MAIGYELLANPMIGIFDSGIGGLSVARAIRDRAPAVDILYFGDTENAPYGLKDPEELQKLTLRAMRILREKGATHLVSACNSVSASVVRPLLELFGIHDSGIVEMVGPTTNSLLRRTNGTIVVIATQATVASGIYQKGFREAGLEISMVAAPRLAGAIELGAPLSEIEAHVAAAVTEAVALKGDTLVLGCTHFPFVRNLFEKHLARVGSEATVFDPADSVAASALAQHGILGQGISQFLTSKNSAIFRHHLTKLFGDGAIPREIEMERKNIII